MFNIMALHRFLFSILTASALIQSSCTASALQQQTVLGNWKSNGPFDEDFGRLANETLERWKCPGLSIAVVDGDDTWAAVSSKFPTGL